MATVEVIGHKMSTNFLLYIFTSYYRTRLTSMEYMFKVISLKINTFKSHVYPSSNPIKHITMSSAKAFHLVQDIHSGVDRLLRFSLPSNLVWVLRTDIQKPKYNLRKILRVWKQTFSVFQQTSLLAQKFFLIHMAYIHFSFYLVHISHIFLESYQNSSYPTSRYFGHIQDVMQYADCSCASYNHVLVYIQTLFPFVVALNKTTSQTSNVFRFLILHFKNLFYN